MGRRVSFSSPLSVLRGGGLDIRHEHIYRLRVLSRYRNDPFDIALFAQSLEDNLTIFNANVKFDQYSNVIILW